MTATARTGDTLSVSAFAARQGVIEGVVRKAIRSGRLERSVGRDAKGHPFIADPALAEREWTDNRDPNKTRGTTMSEEKRRLVRAQAHKVEIANREKAGALISRRAAEIRFATMVTSAKTKLRGLPSRAKQRIPGLTGPDLAALAELIDEALTELADGDGQSRDV